MSASPAISVVVPTHDRRDLLVDVLAALAHQGIERDRFEVIVVCDGCSDGSADAAREAAQPGGAASGLPLTLLEQTRSGAATARNRGAAVARAPLLLFLDDDMIAEPALIAAHLARHAAAVGAAGVERGSGPGFRPDAPTGRGHAAASRVSRVHTASRASYPTARDDPARAAQKGLDPVPVPGSAASFPPGLLVLGAIPVHPESPRSFLTIGLARWAERRHQRLTAPGCSIPAIEVLTGHLSIPRSVFDALGGFDVRFTAGGTFGGEDIEFGWRAREHGVPVVYEPTAVAHQVYRKSFRALSRDIRHGAAADAAILRLHPEMASMLPFGPTDVRSRWERRAFEATRRRPRLASLMAAPLLLLLDIASRLGATAPLFERLHSLARAHLYALGAREAEPDRETLAAS